MFFILFAGSPGYAKTYCPYCKGVKKILAELGVEAKYIELDLRGDGAELQSQLEGITGRRTVPQVFVGEKFVGGFDDTSAAFKSGELKRLIDDLSRRAGAADGINIVPSGEGERIEI